MTNELKKSPEAEALKITLDNDKVSPIRVCFICTGNTCRSPMAEAVLNFLGNGKYFAVSAGLYANEGEPISESSVTALEKAGILPSPDADYREHTAVLLDALMCEGCDRLITMTEWQYLRLCTLFPKYIDKFSVMSREIPDPFLCPQEIYDKTLDEITKSVKEMFSL